jgi:hypothetical protein
MNVTLKVDNLELKSLVNNKVNQRLINFRTWWQMSLKMEHTNSKERKKRQAQGIP